MADPTPIEDRVAASGWTGKKLEEVLRELRLAEQRLQELEGQLRDYRGFVWEQRAVEAEQRLQELREGLREVEALIGFGQSSAAIDKLRALSTPEAEPGGSDAD